MAGFPNVPNVPGVPPLLRTVGTVLSVALLVRDVLSFFGLLAPRWGIFQDGMPVIEAEAVIDFGYKQTWNLSDYTVEGGGFETYNKVSTPFDARVRFASGGSDGARIALLQSIEAIASNVELYDVVTPDRVYRNCNVSHYDYRRTATNGAGMILLDVWLLEVRTSAQAAFSDTKTPSGADPTHAGIVQPKEWDGSGFSLDGVT